MHLAKISLAEIREPAHVARAVIDEALLDELAASIRKIGLANPITVKEVEGGYEVVAGHRRFLASRRAGLLVVNCVVLSSRDADPTAIQLHENLYRQELSPVEEAAFFAELLPRCHDDTAELAELVKQSLNYVEGRLLLLQGDPDVLAAVAQHEIQLGVAAEINKMERKPDREEALHWARNGQMTVQQARQFRMMRNASAPPLTDSRQGAEAQSPASFQGRDIFICLLCGQKEPVTDLEFHHVHRFCRIQMEAARNEAREPVAQHEGDPARDGGV
jgi:ParB/RepB/Spo0J family partition protein